MVVGTYWPKVGCLLFRWALFGINKGNKTEGLRIFVDIMLRKIIWVQEAGGLGHIFGPNVKINLGKLSSTVEKWDDLHV